MGFTPKQLGHLVIKVRDLDRAEDFYTRIMGLTVMNRRAGHMVFMSANTDLTHELAIASVGENAPGPDDSGVGLSHMAWQMDSYDDLKELYHRLKENNVRINRIVEHRLSRGVYLQDPDGNGIEVYYELPRSLWSKYEGKFSELFPEKLEEEPVGVADN